MTPSYFATAAAAVALVPAAVLAQSGEPRGDIVVTARALSPTAQATGQTATTIDDSAIRGVPATTIADLVKLSPGVAIIQGNGPRDIGLSIRGSNARNSFGARNIQVFEDDFPVTQPDGLARFDLADPHAYGAVDVVRGPSSARYGNYALGGAVNFRTRRGRDIDGLDVGTDVGGDGYGNVYATFGHGDDRIDYSVFGSIVGGKGATGHSDYRTATINALATAELGPNDRLAAKLIYNAGEFRLSTRLSYDQYLANPYQQGCARAATAAAGCGTIQVFVNGRNGQRIAQTATEGDLARDDRRAILGARYEHDFSATATWRTQATFDSRIVYQPTSSTPFRGGFESYNLTSDVTADHRIAGLSATGFVGLFYNHLDSRSFSFSKTPAGRDGFGAPTQTVIGTVDNVGVRAREDLALAPRLGLIVGVGGERSTIDVAQTAYAYPLSGAAILTPLPARRVFWNVAPDAALRWQAIDAVQLHARVATGYGIPQAGNLFVTASGVPGNNLALRPQRNVGVDIGAAVTIGKRLDAEITAYREWFRDELVGQSAGIDLLAYTSNVPRSLHQGIEIGATWRPVAGARLQGSYSYNDQHYTRFQERLTAGRISRVFDRDGNAIPGVVPTVVNARAGYDRASGDLQGLGGFVEGVHRSRYAIDNANLLTVPGHVLVNLNLHYDPPAAPGSAWSRIGVFVVLQNVFDTVHVGSAAVIGDSLSASTGEQNSASVLRTTTGSLYAGAPRTIYAGIRSRFR
ncbi:TonB-dependent receptor family protein [Sphingomonas sp. Tas61C01]|uniref:TonB-dependent receptor family protein n=1 Tax=Sphingomonas sp. Tas61C01 TaxID=3458297 RepID=UPI00403EE3EE